MKITSLIFSCIILITILGFFEHVIGQDAAAAAASSTLWKKDWFVGNITNYPCTLPRIRRAFGDMSYDDRKTYVRAVYQMKLHKEAFVSNSKSLYNLYDIFYQIHASSYNGMFHGTSAFPFHHKALLWLYESAIIYTALKDGPIMSPPISQADACKITLPYWEWDQGYSETANNWNGLLTSDVFQYADLLGDGTPQSGSYYVDTGYFSYTGGYTLATSICATTTPNKTYCDTDLKRLMDLTAMSVGSPQIRAWIGQKTTFATFLPYFHGTIHAMIHHFVAFSMYTTSTASQDPLFFMHHCNIDRFFHLWADCQGLADTVTSSSLTNNCNAYAQINPISGTAIMDPINKVAYSVDVDAQMNFYLQSNTSQAIFIPKDQWPTVRQMWTMGTAASPGWQGLYYRYGADKMATALVTANLCSSTSWVWVNQS